MSHLALPLGETLAETLLDPAAKAGSVAADGRFVENLHLERRDGRLAVDAALLVFSALVSIVAIAASSLAIASGWWDLAILAIPVTGLSLFGTLAATVALRKTLTVRVTVT